MSAILRVLVFLPTKGFTGLGNCPTFEMFGNPADLGQNEKKPLGRNTKLFGNGGRVEISVGVICGCLRFRL